MATNSLIQIAAEIINHDGVISYPTESVYGLGCNPLSEIAVNKILHLKQRSVDKGLIIIAGNIEQLLPYIDITAAQKKKMIDESQTVTWIVRKSPLTPRWVSGEHNKVAIRISKHPVVMALCKATNQAIISTSANPAGKEPAISSEESQRYFLDSVAIYLDNSCPLTGQPTQIKDIDTNQIIR